MFTLSSFVGLGSLATDQKGKEREKIQKRGKKNIEVFSIQAHSPLYSISYCLLPTYLPASHVQAA